MSVLTMLSNYLDRLWAWAWLPATALVVAFAIGFALRRFPTDRHPRLTRAASYALLAIALVAGLAFAWQKASLYDDAFISFRYARNLLDGHGLVFNVGERVEGYTNFLWTVLLAGLVRVFACDLPYAALVAGPVCFAGNLVTVFLIGRRLSAPEPGQVYVPIAVLWLALHHTFHSYATTGLETMFASWLVNLGIWCLVARDDARGLAGAALFLILATLTRPDHGLFFAALAVVVCWRAAGRGWASRSDRAAVALVGRDFARGVAVMVLPFGLYVAYLAWKVGYYGEALPNTFYAKSGGLSYWEQGLKYGLVVALSSHFVVLAPMFIAWLATGRDEAADRFKRFAGVTVAVYSFYVIRLGGDQMYNRFFQVLLPILLLGVEQLVHRVARRSERRPSYAGVICTALVCATVYGIPVVKDRESLWFVSDPSNRWAVQSLDPLKVGWRGGKRDRIAPARLLRRTFTDKGVEPVIADGGIGIFAYYSGLPMIDLIGLTDRYVASQPVRRRGKPGHEKSAPPAYLDHRNVRLTHRAARGEESRYTKITINGRRFGRCRLYRYDGELMRTITERSPKVGFVRFPNYLDRYRKRLTAGRPVDVARRLREFDHYYFSLNADPERRAWFADRFTRLWGFEDAAFPDETKVTGSFGFVRPADGDFSVRFYQGETVIASGSDGSGTGEVAFPEFEITGDEIGFLIGGGRDRDRLHVCLEVEGTERFRAVGGGKPRLRFVTWNVRRYKGQTARLVLVDTSPDGRLLFDMFYEAEAD